MPLKPNLSFSGLEEFVNEHIVSEPTVKKLVVETSEAKDSADKPKTVKKNNGAPIIEDWVSDSEEEDIPQAKIQKKIIEPSFAKIEFVKSEDQVKSLRKTVNHVNQNRQNTHTPRGNKRNWNNMILEVDVHLYRSMIGSLMYLTSSRPDIMFVVCVYARYQVNPKVSHLNAVKRIFRYLKGQPKLGLWYPKDSPFDLVAYTDGDYARASLDKKSTIGGCQFLGCRLISWQCKKQTMVAKSITEAEYVAASSCCGQVLWIQNQLLDYGYNFMHTKIYIDNESTICIVKNPVFHSKIKHIEIRHQFIRNSNEKKLIQMIKIHIDKNVADLLTKAFYKGIRVNTGDSKLMLLGINLLLLGKVNAARHNLLLLVLQALVDGKKIIITEATVRRDLQLEDADGVDCLPNATIFKHLTLIVTPLFPTMVVQAQDEMGEGSAMPTDPHHTPNIYVNHQHSNPKEQKSRGLTSQEMKICFGVNDLEGEDFEKCKSSGKRGCYYKEPVYQIVLLQPSKVTRAATNTNSISSQQPTQVNDKAKVEADYQLAQRLQAQEQEELSNAEATLSCTTL
ncbi:hypothetical protein Tco_0859003 [Tanacetum coccineum]|uniref:Uncharacterized protein n=1 Tax=Tanacetum coccineum TaxID=301880 RepID=A0ABQ5BAR6_9ASTR